MTSLVVLDLWSVAEFDSVRCGASRGYDGVEPVEPVANYSRNGAVVIISGARVLLTGASGGIGAAIAAAFTRKGAQLIMSGRDRRSMGVQAALPTTTVIAADLTDESAVRRLARDAGEVDVLVSNAGVGWYGSTADMPCGDLRRLVDINLLAPLLLTRLLLPGMVERGRGHIVFIGSVAGHLGVENEAVYSATKAAVRTYAEALRSEVRRHGVDVSVVSPGAVDTSFFEHRGSPYQRSWPRPVPADGVAAAVLRAVEHSDRLVFIPHWMRLPALLHDGLPAVYRGLADKFG
ncbi:MAG: SDR family NAD(P)-dependent oxidoreductase [Acidothermaceae bacterium]